MDGMGNIIGIGDKNCFTEDLSTGSDSYITNCGKDEYCLTDMEVDWLPIGEQITTIRRKCSKESFPSRLD